jgi:hypothetical protein
VVAVATVVGLAAWAAGRALVDADSGRLADLAVVAGLGLAGAGLVVLGYRLVGLRGVLSERTGAGGPPAVAGAGGDAEVLA